MPKSLAAYAHKKFIQYEVMTAVYVMEPWEKSLFNTVFLVLISLSTVTIYQYTAVILSKVSGFV